MHTLKQFIQEHKLRFSYELTDVNPQMAVSSADEEWYRSATHWRCVIRKRGRQMTVYFSQGPAISREPSLEEVLDCVASDAAGYDNARSFEEWTREYGYDTDSRKAERIYQNIKRQTDALVRMLGGPEAARVLLYETERL